MTMPGGHEFAISGESSSPSDRSIMSQNEAVSNTSGHRKLLQISLPYAPGPPLLPLQPHSLGTACSEKLHRELTATRRHGTKVADITKHLAQRCVGFDTHGGGAGLLGFDHTPATVEITDHIANMVFGVYTSIFIIGSISCGAALGIDWR